MHDELTYEDIRKMKEELDYRRRELIPASSKKSRERGLSEI